jgi:hypothetical protein
MPAEARTHKHAAASTRHAPQERSRKRVVLQLAWATQRLQATASTSARAKPLPLPEACRHLREPSHMRGPVVSHSVACVAALVARIHAGVGHWRGAVVMWDRCDDRVALLIEPVTRGGCLACNYMQPHPRPAACAEARPRSRAMRRRAPPKSAAAAARRLAQSVRLRAGVAAAHAHERVALRDDRRKASLRRRRCRRSAGLRTPRKFMRNIPR